MPAPSLPDRSLTGSPLKILILKPSSLGDVVQALPVLRLLKSHRPDSEIYWWLSSELIPLLRQDPDLSGIIGFNRKHWRSLWSWPELFRSLRTIRRHRFDWVIDLQSLARSALVAWLARGQWTVGLDDSREGAPAFYDDRVPRPSAETHAVDWYLQVLERLGVPVHWNFDWLPVPALATETFRHQWPEDGRQWILLQPGARWLNKRWPAAYFFELIQLLAAESRDLRFAILGSQAEAVLADQIAHAVPGQCLNLAGRTTLPEMVEWIRRGDLLITNDTGPMHIAAALRKPVIALFGPTNPHRTGPYGQNRFVLQTSLECVPCLSAKCRHRPELECLQALKPAVVLPVVLQRLREVKCGRLL